MPSSVAHVRRSLKKTLSILLDKEEIMSELLKEYEPEIAKDFIKTYVNLYKDGKRIKDGKEMNVITTLPQESVDLDATFFIDMGEGSEDEQAIGNLINVYENDGDGTANIERLTPVIDTAAGTVVLTTSALIGDLIDIKEFDIPRDNITVENKTITLLLGAQNIYNFGLLDDDFIVTVKYMPKTDKETFGTVRGYNVTEDVRVIMMSYNLNTLRIMDTLMKASLILMRNFDKEQETYALANASYSGNSPIDQDTLPNLPYPIYGRQVDITYHVTYGIDNRTTQILKDINLYK